MAAKAYPARRPEARTRHPTTPIQGCSLVCAHPGRSHLCIADSTLSSNILGFCSIVFSASQRGHWHRRRWWRVLIWAICKAVLAGAGKSCGAGFLRLRWRESSKEFRDRPPPTHEGLGGATRMEMMARQNPGLRVHPVPLRGRCPRGAGMHGASRLALPKCAFFDLSRISGRFGLRGGGCRALSEDFRV